MEKYVGNFTLTTEEASLFSDNFKKLFFERNGNSYILTVLQEESGNPKFIYIGSNRVEKDISEEENNRLSFFPEYLAGKETIITNTGLICFIDYKTEDEDTVVSATIYDLIKKDETKSLNDIAFDTSTMYFTNELLPGYGEYNTPLSYFKIAYMSPADKSIVNFPFDNHQKKYTLGSNLYVSFPVDRINDIFYNDAGLFAVPATMTELDSLCYKYNQLFMFRAKEQLFIKVYGITDRNAREELRTLVKTNYDENTYTTHIDLSNYLPEKYKYFEFKITRNSAIEELPDCERFVEVVC